MIKGDSQPKFGRISLTGIQKTYLLGKQSVPALRGVDLEIQSGEFIGVTGPSGCGKTTLLNLIGAIDKATKGTIVVGGINLTSASDNTLADIRLKHIGFIFQFYNLLSYFTARENVEMPMTFLNVSKKERRKRAKALLSSLGIGDRGDHLPSELSGGEQQRVAIARALANNPSIILADEPTGDLDSATGEEIMNILVDLNEQRGVTIVLVTHDPPTAQYAKRILRMQDGIIAKDISSPME
ncbi:MAG: ABC transporter ATP-binding protein [Candidatus Hodarchaeales archaeon]|jgi:putative ABC transport system ATP-binding protein